MAVASLQVLGGTPAIPPALLYTDSDNKGFLVNPGEGIQRMILESPGIRIGNISDIITTHCSWETCASIPGISLFRRDQFATNHSPLHVWGCEKVEEFMNITQKECFADEVKVDKHLKIRDISMLYQIGAIEVSVKKLKTSHCLLFKLPQKAPKVNKDLLLQYKIPQKSLPQLFKAGAVTLSDGTVVKKEDVLEEPQAAPMFLVVNCNSREEAALLNEKNFELQSSDGKNELLIVCHFTPEAVIKSEEYAKFLSNFKQVDHLWLYRNDDSAILGDCRERNALLSTLVPVGKLYTNKDSSQENVPPGIVASRHLLKYHLFAGRKTQFGWNDSNLLPKDVVLGDRLETASKLYSRIKHKVNNSPAKKIKLQEAHFPDILFLGTTSTYSSTYRNVSGILCSSPNMKFILDSGEFTVGQLIRLYGPVHARSLISKLDFLYISHIHFDHCGGALEVARIFHEETSSSLVIYCPLRAMAWFGTLSKLFNIPLRLVPLGSIAIGDKSKFQDVSSSKYTLNVCPARHTRDSWCVVVQGQHWKIAYSGDTMPTEDFVEIGKNCDVLIHEATHQSSLAADAALKKHSTVKQALEIGQKMAATYIILTHFSLRYQKIPPIANEKIPPNALLAYDFMVVTPGNVREWCDFTEIIPEIFPTEYQDLLKHHHRKKAA